MTVFDKFAMESQGSRNSRPFDPLIKNSHWRSMMDGRKVIPSSSYKSNTRVHNASISTPNKRVLTQLPVHPLVQLSNRDQDSSSKHLTKMNVRDPATSEKSGKKSFPSVPKSSSPSGGTYRSSPNIIQVHPAQNPRVQIVDSKNSNTTKKLCDPNGKTKSLTEPKKNSNNQPVLVDSSKQNSTVSAVTGEKETSLDLGYSSTKAVVEDKPPDKTIAELACAPLGLKKQPNQENLNCHSPSENFCHNNQDNPAMTIVEHKYSGDKRVQKDIFSTKKRISHLSKFPSQCDSEIPWNEPTSSLPHSIDRTVPIPHANENLAVNQVELPSSSTDLIAKITKSMDSPLKGVVMNSKPGHQPESVALKMPVVVEKVKKYIPPSRAPKPLWDKTKRQTLDIKRNIQMHSKRGYHVVKNSDSKECDKSLNKKDTSVFKKKKPKLIPSKISEKNVATSIAPRIDNSKVLDIFNSVENYQQKKLNEYKIPKKKTRSPVVNKSKDLSSAKSSSIRSNQKSKACDFKKKEKLFDSKKHKKPEKRAKTISESETDHESCESENITQVGSRKKFKRIRLLSDEETPISQESPGISSLVEIVKVSDIIPGSSVSLKENSNVKMPESSDDNADDFPLMPNLSPADDESTDENEHTTGHTAETPVLSEITETSPKNSNELQNNSKLQCFIVGGSKSQSISKTTKENISECGGFAPKGSSLIESYGCLQEQSHMLEIDEGAFDVQNKDIKSVNNSDHKNFNLPWDNTCKPVEGIEQAIILPEDKSCGDEINNVMLNVKNVPDPHATSVSRESKLDDEEDEDVVFIEVVDVRTKKTCEIVDLTDDDPKTDNSTCDINDQSVLCIRDVRTLSGNDQASKMDFSVVGNECASTDLMNKASLHESNVHQDVSQSFRAVFQPPSSADVDKQPTQSHSDQSACLLGTTASTSEIVQLRSISPTANRLESTVSNLPEQFVNNLCQNQPIVTAPVQVSSAETVQDNSSCQLSNCSTFQVSGTDPVMKLNTQKENPDERLKKIIKTDDKISQCVNMLTMYQQTKNESDFAKFFELLSHSSRQEQQVSKNTSLRSSQSSSNSSSKDNFDQQNNSKNLSNLCVPSNGQAKKSQEYNDRSTLSLPVSASDSWNSSERQSFIPALSQPSGVRKCVVCGRPQPSFCTTCKQSCCYNSFCIEKHYVICQKLSK